MANTLEWWWAGDLFGLQGTLPTLITFLYMLVPRYKYLIPRSLGPTCRDPCSSPQLSKALAHFSTCRDPYLLSNLQKSLLVIQLFKTFARYPTPKISRL